MHNQKLGQRYDERRQPRSSRLYNGLFRVFGPAQLGDPGEAPPPPAPKPAPCPRCGTSLTTHVFVETPDRKRLLRCSS